tara:strand:- start:95 stop:1333 length:1239 start_codon:yes stop_codon:yes gene_type:complete
VPDYSGSFSGSYEGNGNQLTNIDYYNLSNLPITITPFQKNSILANNSIRDNFVANVKARLSAESVISSSAQLLTEFDVRYGNEIGDDLISGSAQIKPLLPSGTVSGSAQTVANLPSGIVSGSVQIDYDLISDKPTTITADQSSAITTNSNKVGYTDAAVKAKLSTEGVISGSSQITITESQISDLQSYLTSVPVGTISSSAQIAGLGYLTSETDSQTLTYVGDTLTISNGNSVTIPTGSNLPDGIVSGSVLRTLDGTTVLSGSKTQIPAGTISGSSQISALGYITSETDSQQLTLSGNNLSISNGNSVSLAGLGSGGSGGSSIWNTGSQDPGSYTHLMTSNNLKVTGSVDIKGDFTVNGQSVFTQTSASDAGNALVVKGRLKILEEQIGSYIASASIQVGNTKDTIDGGGFF